MILQLPSKMTIGELMLIMASEYPGKSLRYIPVKKGARHALQLQSL